MKILEHPAVKASLEAFVADPSWENETKLANVIRAVLLKISK